MGATTTPTLSLEMTSRQVAVSDLLPQIFGIGLVTSVPCNHTLFRFLVLVNHRRAIQSAEPRPTVAAFDDMLSILDQVTAFQTDEWSKAMSTSQKLHHSPTQQPKVSEQKPVDVAEWNWTPLGEVYKAAIALYCISSLVQVDTIVLRADSSTFKRAAEVFSKRAHYYQSLIGNLRKISSGPILQLRKLIFWPVAIAGILAEDENERNFLVGELVFISRELGTAAALVARDFLVRLWSKEKHDPHAKRRWDDKFDRPYIFAI